MSIHVEVEPTQDNALEDTSYTQCELIRSINRNRLVHRLGTVDLETRARVEAIVRTLLGY